MSNIQGDSAGTNHRVPKPGRAPIEPPAASCAIELTWASRSGFYAHRQATFQVIGSHLPAAERRALANAHVIASDAEFQCQESAHRYAMRRTGQTSDAARLEANEFVRQQYSNAWNADSLIEALTEFGVALHALQDSTLPLSAEFQLWSPNASEFEKIRYVRNELCNPGADSELYRATRQAWEWFTCGSLPEGDLFIFGRDSFSVWQMSV